MVQVDTVGGGNCAADRPLNLDLVNIKLDLQSIYLEDCSAFFVYIPLSNDIVSAGKLFIFI